MLTAVKSFLFVWSAFHFQYRICTNIWYSLEDVQTFCNRFEKVKDHRHVCVFLTLRMNTPDDSVRHRTTYLMIILNTFRETIFTGLSSRVITHDVGAKQTRRRMGGFSRLRLCVCCGKKNPTWMENYVWEDGWAGKHAAPTSLRCCYLYPGGRECGTCVY